MFGWGGGPLGGRVCCCYGWIFIFKIEAVCSQAAVALPCNVLPLRMLQLSDVKSLLV